jgi:hypothetical protein
MAACTARLPANLPIELSMVNPSELQQTLVVDLSGPYSGTQLHAQSPLTL